MGYPEEVPPTGMMEWKPREDALVGTAAPARVCIGSTPVLCCYCCGVRQPKGVEALRAELGSPPLVLHSRHISPRSPYVAEGEWWIDEVAHPKDNFFFEQVSAQQRSAA